MVQFELPIFLKSVFFFQSPLVPSIVPPGSKFRWVYRAPGCPGPGPIDLPFE